MPLNRGFGSADMGVMSRRSQVIGVLARVLAGVLGAFLAIVFVLSMLIPPTEGHLVALGLGAVAGVLLFFCRTGSRHPWSAALFLPALYLLQVPAIYIALDQFPHQRSVHVLFSLAAALPLMLALAVARRVRAPMASSPSATSSDVAGSGTG